MSTRFSQKITLFSHFTKTG